MRYGDESQLPVQLTPIADPPHCSESLFLLTKGRYLVARGTTDPEQEEGCVLLLEVEN